MDQKALTDLNIGENLDNLANLDPRGYGVCRILYKASREYTGMPTTMNSFAITAFGIPFEIISSARASALSLSFVNGMNAMETG